MPKARPRRMPPQRGPRPKGRRPQRPQAPPTPPEPAAPVAVAETGTVVALPKTIIVGDLARALDVSVVDVIRGLVNMGVMVSINQSVDFETATLVANELGIETRAEEEAAPVVEEQPEAEIVGAKEILWQDEDPAKLKPRPPVITVLGHVDHGKTSLLDAIRVTNVTAREAGGITQHIGAYQIEHNGRKVTFLDTPGHEAFTAMRARGAQVTDVAVLVVAADDGVQPQTVEAISHVKAAKVPIVVALNKIDRPDANPDQVKAQLAEHGVTIEEYGGDTPLVPVSAKTKQGIEDLVEVIMLVADVAELKADPDRPAIGRVIEAHLDKGRGPVATVLVQTGTLERGDLVVAGTTFGKVRAMVDDKGKNIGRAEPSRPAEILGLPEVPEAGDVIRVVPDEKSAKALVARNARERAGSATAERPATLDEMFAQVKEGKAKELKLVLKADVQGSLEAIKGALAKVPQDEVALSVIHDAVGDITESDLTLAAASGAVVIGFNTKMEAPARRVADSTNVDVRQYKVIYELLDDVQKALTGLLEPEMVESTLGHAEVRQIFTSGKTTIAGCMVVDGVVRRGAQARLLRGGTAVYDGRIATLRRIKDDVREVNAGLECGIVLENNNDVQVGDIIDCYVVQPKPR
ncbi:MAG: translation initiation factor IF-2 [Chloroflexi bacterium]|nr:MAG: translation initiation factor IF-2 [Chloroflexota bacterium]